MSPPNHLHKVRLFLEFAPGFSEQEVPGPLLWGADGFDHVLDLVEAASAGLLEHLQARGLSRGDSRAPVTKAAQYPWL